MNSMIDHHAVLVRIANPNSYTTPVFKVTESVEEIRKDQIGIADVRDIIEKANRTPFGEAATQIIFVVTSFITVEAQQALLKIIEEPPATTKFMFVVPQNFSLLSTLLSRFSVMETEDESCDSEPFAAFTKLPLAKKMEEIEKVCKNKDSHWQNDIKCGLIDYLTTHSRKHTRDELEVLQYVATTLQTRGASNKFLLEQLALSL